MEGTKNDSDKPPLGLIDRVALEEIAKVMAFGERKYARFNWRGGFKYSRLYDAALRHIEAFIDGEDLDEESGLSHIAHAQCCLIFLQRMIKDKPELDDRYKEQEVLPKRQAGFIIYNPKLGIPIYGPKEE